MATKIPSELLGVTYASPNGTHTVFLTMEHPHSKRTDWPNNLIVVMIEKITWSYLDEGPFVIIRDTNGLRLFLRFKDCYNFVARPVK